MSKSQSIHPLRGRASAMSGAALNPLCSTKLCKNTSEVLRICAPLRGVDGIDVVAENEDNKDPLSNIQAASTQNKIALGPRKGKNIRRLIEQLEEEFRCAEPRMTGDMAASFMGFSLYAGVSVWSSNKARLEQFIRYSARPAVSEERLSQASNGDIIYKLKKPWTDGTTAVIFSSLEFLEKLLSLVFALDMDNCELCGGQMKAISAILKQDVIEKILTHLRLPARAPPIAPSNIPRQEAFWDQTPDYGDYSQVH